MSYFPSRLSTFIGRQTDIVALEKLVQKSRLITILGPGGIGKTRLSLQMPGVVASYFKDGTIFIPLSSVRNPDYLIPVISNALGIKKESGNGIFDSLISFLRDREMLLILDNFEQIITARRKIRKILECCPKIKFLVTSRETLQIAGEQIYPLTPFRFPEKDQLQTPMDWMAYESIQLFVQRAKLAAPNFQLDEVNAPIIAEICCRLDGLPLAIELAASRIRLLSPHAMLKRLKDCFTFLSNKSADLPKRHQTIFNTIRWSYELLNNEDQQLLRFLSVFVGGCGLNALEQLWTEMGNDDAFVLDNISSLFNKSLVFQEEDPDGEPRIMLLDTIRQFGKNELSAQEELQYTQLFCAHYLTLVAKAKPHLSGPGQQDWLLILEKEQNNLRTLFDRLVIHGNDLEKGVQLVKGLYRYWLIRNPSAGMERTLQLINRLEPRQEPPEALAELFNYAGTLAQVPGQYLQSVDYYGKSLEIYRQLNDRQGIAVTLNHLGWMGWRLGDFEQAKQRSSEALELHKALQNENGIATSLNNLGAIAQNQGDFQKACDYHREALSIRTQLSDQRAIAFSKLNLGLALSYCGAFSDAKAILMQGLEVFESLNDTTLIGYSYNVMADLEFRRNDLEVARSIIEEKALPIVRHLGSFFGQGLALRVLGDVYLAKGNEALAEKYYTESYKYRKKSNDNWCSAQSLHRLALLALRKNNLPVASEKIWESLSRRLRMRDKFGLLECLESCFILACHNKDFKLAALLNHAQEHFFNKYQIFISPADEARYASHQNVVSSLYNHFPQPHEQQINPYEDIWDFVQHTPTKFNRLFGKDLEISPEVTPNSDSFFLKKLERVVLEQLSDESFKVEPDLCRAMTMSRPQLYRKLKILKGTSPSDYIRQIRMRQARHLITTTDKPIAEISAEVGFKYPSYFSKSYLDTFEETPLETRKSANHKQ